MLYVIFFSMFSRAHKNLRFEVRSQKSDFFTINVCVIQYFIVSNVFQFYVNDLNPEIQMYELQVTRATETLRDPQVTNKNKNLHPQFSN